MDEYIWRVANILGDNIEYHLRRLCKLHRDQRHGYQSTDEPRLPYEHLLRVRRQPGQQGDGWNEHGRERAADPYEHEPWMIDEEPTKPESRLFDEMLMDESIWHLCMTAMCILLFYV